jgi:hypothetical protein
MIQHIKQQHKQTSLHPLKYLSNILKDRLPLYGEFVYLFSEVNENIITSSWTEPQLVRLRRREIRLYSADNERSSKTASVLKTMWYVKRSRDRSNLLSVTDQIWNIPDSQSFQTEVSIPSKAGSGLIGQQQTPPSICNMCTREYYCFLGRDAPYAGNCWLHLQGRKVITVLTWIPRQQVLPKRW